MRRISFNDSDTNPKRKRCREIHPREYPQWPLDHQLGRMGAKGVALVACNEGELTEHMGRESGPLKDEQNSRPESLPEDNGKPRAEPEMEQSPNQSPREPWVEQGRVPQNIPTQNAGWGRGKSETMLRRSTPRDIPSVPEAFHHMQDQGSPLDGAPIYWTQLQRREPLSLHPRPQSFH
jgi:hypothetical protein